VGKGKEIYMEMGFFWVWGYCMAFKDFDRDKGFRDLGIVV